MSPLEQGGSRARSVSMMSRELTGLCPFVA